MSVLVEILKKGFFELNIDLVDSQLEKFQIFHRLIIETNKCMNLTSIVEEKEFAVKHFIDSVSCLKATSINIGMKLLDVGTGAGFPGIPLKVCCPDLKVTLVESKEKIVIFLNNAIKEMGLYDIEIVHARAEDIGKDQRYREGYDLVTARAVAGLGVLAEYCLPSVKTGGFFLAMKGPRLAEEISAAKRSIMVMGGEINKVVSLKLPITGDERNLVLIEKIKPTPQKYPRRPGIPLKKPI
ncbi:MAG: Ribosomal RNA small subunit methyltransferase G [Pelotomaculum sp. PtaU1.Bin035]|nr:MAG: Ribosomal RNA small subunit methyltransferase G [Pelotomaculum sp. PtaU1.Bin035]